MDPNACLERWRDAMEDGDRSEARHAASDLRRWINGGGFEPEWRDGERARVMSGDTSPPRGISCNSRTNDRMREG